MNAERCVYVSTCVQKYKYTGSQNHWFRLRTTIIFRRTNRDIGADKEPALKAVVHAETVGAKLVVYAGMQREPFMQT